MRRPLAVLDTLVAIPLYAVFVVILGGLAYGFGAAAWLLVTNGYWWAALLVLAVAGFGVYCVVASRRHPSVY